MLIPGVLLAWTVEGFWTLLELCVRDGNAITTTQDIFIYESIVRADLMLLCSKLADFSGRVMRERIEPAFVLVAFYLIFESRITILESMHALRKL